MKIEIGDNLSGILFYALIALVIIFIVGDFTCKCGDTKYENRETKDSVISVPVKDLNMVIKDSILINYRDE